MERFEMPEGWQRKKLGSIAKIISGSTPRTNIPGYWNGDVLWATPKDLGKLQKIEIDKTERTITQKGLNSCSAQMLPSGSVLLTSRAPIGHLAINTKPMCTNQGFKNLVPNSEVYNRYLYWSLKFFVKELQHIGRGGTFKEISKSLVASFEIPIPPLDEQKRIVARIEELTRRVEEVDGLRREAVGYIDWVIPSAMDLCFTGKDDWLAKPLSRICSMKTGKTPPTKNREYFDGNIPFVCPGDFNSELRISTAQRSLSIRSLEDRKATLFEKDTVLIVCIGSTLGKVGLATKSLCSNQQITGLIFNEEVLPAYAAWFLTWLKDTIRNAAAGTGVPIINQNGIGQLLISYPKEKSYQQTIVQYLDKLKSKAEALKLLQAETEAELAAFTPALLAKAFRGEL